MKLGIGRREVDQVIGMREHDREFRPLPVPNECLDLLLRQWPREPLHVVLDEDLHRGALDRARPFDRAMDPAPNGHVSAEENV